MAAAKPKPFQFQLDLHSGVPVYRQIVDQVSAGIATGSMTQGEQLPTVRQLAVDLSVNPNTVVRAYRELEIRGLLTTEQGSGTFISSRLRPVNDADRQSRLRQLAGEVLGKAGIAGFHLDELIAELERIKGDAGKPKGK